ncbi:unnamed protein product [Adineta steineri]|uniref:Uncharacterized protein n=1 Tax=Adineta steineri TaxID=433720 RepID=A0A815XPN3_9BILA|nr:unnamed protein product [Adineta steineri]CAF1560773.1 unnamed protein product [Adineta steineri]
MECRLVLNNLTDRDLTNDYMRGLLHQQLKYQKYRRVPARNGKSIFYLFFQKEEDTYAALRAAKSIKEISLMRYNPLNPMISELPFRPFPPQHIIDICRYAFRKYLDKFNNVGLFKTFIRRLAEQIMAQYIKKDEIHERIEKLFTWWWMNEKFIVKDNYSIHKLLDVFFS